MRNLASRWASVKFGEDLIASKERGAPNIVRLPNRRDKRSSTAGKTVIERLAEMRVADGASKKTKKRWRLQTVFEALVGTGGGQHPRAVSRDVCAELFEPRLSPSVCEIECPPTPVSPHPP